jgi:predicted nucleic acid-binding protein
MARPFIADTSLLIDYFRGVEKARFLGTAYEEGIVHIPAIVRYELLCGVRNPKHSKQRQRFLQYCPALDLTAEIADKAAELFTALRTGGRTTDNEDILIAATAIIHELPVATLNRAHFEGIPGLQIIDE